MKIIEVESCTKAKTTDTLCPYLKVFSMRKEWYCMAVNNVGRNAKELFASCPLTDKKQT